jgi:tetratricopeptide (TPR) repeat protein
MACKWDRDTLLEEAKNHLDTVKAIVGWFDRYPARYYEMRLERVTKELAANPASLELFDDAGVACNRLGRHDDAIAWMARKNAAMEGLPAKTSATPRYRYLANLGSFHMDRWIAQTPEARNADLEDLREAETLVATAIKLNPEAHFGREIYQLAMIRWLLGNSSDDPYFTGSFLERALDGGGGRTEFPQRGEKAVQGLTGLVLLGEGWGSPDVFSTLEFTLDETNSASVAQLAYCRAKELEQSGVPSLHPLTEVRERMAARPSSALSPRKQEVVNDYFPRVRTAAEERRTKWLAFLESRFDEGMHPDTHADFWSGWIEPEFPEMPGPTLSDRMVEKPGLALGIILTALLLGMVLVYRVVRRFLW